MISLIHNYDATQNALPHKSVPGAYTYDTHSTSSDTSVVYTIVDYIELNRVGAWPSRDPIGEGGGLLYGFVQNEPLSRWDYLGLACCTVGDIRNPTVGLTTVRFTGDPNKDKKADDIIAALAEAGSPGKVTDVLQLVAAHLAGGGVFTIAEFGKQLIAKAGLSPDAAAKIAKDLAEFYKKRGKETQGINIWTRVCYKECVSSFWSFFSGNSWKDKCDPWGMYQYKKGPVTIDWWAAESGAATYMKRAYDKAIKDFNERHDL